MIVYIPVALTTVGCLFEPREAVALVRRLTD